MYKFEQKPWWTQGGRNLEELITLEMKAAIRDRVRPAGGRKFNNSSNMSRVLRADYFQVQYELDGAKPLVNLDPSDAFQPPDFPLSRRKPVRTYPPVRVVDVEQDASSDLSYPLSLPRSKCAVRPSYYGNVPGRMHK